MWNCELMVRQAIPVQHEIADNAWFRRPINLPFLPFKDMEIDLGLGDGLYVYVGRIVWRHDLTKFRLLGSIRGLGFDASSINGHRDAMNWFNERGFEYLPNEEL